MISALLAILSSALTGGGDFTAGVSSRRIGAIPTSFWSYLAATVVLLGIFPFIAAVWTPESVTAGLVAALCGGMAYVAFYGSLALAPMGVATAIVAASQAVVPVAIGVGWNGESMSAFGWIGVALAVLGAVIVGAAEGGRGRAALSAVLLAVFAGVAFGATVVALSAVPSSSGLIAPTIEMAGGLVLIAVLLGLVRRSARVRAFAASIGLHREPGPGGTAGLTAGSGIGMALLSGLLQGVAIVVLMLALWGGQLSVVGVILCLYPIMPALLARVFLKERLTRLHVTGIGIALLGCLLLGAA
ncbi:MAG: DMT family transporter [Actinobacteria bacterium]|nr:DMT family transporter [Actinomycetota bacterium]